MSDRFQTGDKEYDHADADDALIAMFRDLIRYAPAGVALRALQLADEYEASRARGWWYS